VALDTAEKFPNACHVFPERHVRGKKRNRGLSISEQSMDERANNVEECSQCTICLRYNSMLFMDFVDVNELLVVEQPWLSIVATFPEALHRRVYGT
jgi:hypothetical protein